MKRICLFTLFVAVLFTNIILAENQTFKPNSIHFNRLEQDTLDSFIHKVGKDSVLHFLDNKIFQAKEILKKTVGAIKNEPTALELILLNKHFKLGLDSFLIFSPNIVIENFSYVLYNERLLSNNYRYTSDFIKQQSQDSVSNLMYKNIHNNYGKISLIVYCEQLHNIVNPKMIDSIYQTSLNYPINMRNDFYFLLIEYDKNCGRDQLKIKEFRKKLFEINYNNLNLGKVLSDTSEFNNLNYQNYKLMPSYQLLAYSLYAYDFDIKKHQKEVIYFLNSQSKLGGFKEFNLAKFENISNPENMVYGLWSLLELREQIGKLYP